jgi:hypothetical protein
LDICSETDDSRVIVSSGHVYRKCMSELGRYGVRERATIPQFRGGRYAFPNDESEQEREDMKHAMIVNLCGGKLHFAPIGDDPQNIVDLGTGTGIFVWIVGARRKVGLCWNSDFV